MAEGFTGVARALHECEAHEVAFDSRTGTPFTLNRCGRPALRYERHGFVRWFCPAHAEQFDAS